MNTIKSIFKLGDQCITQSVKLMSKGLIAFEQSPEKDNVSVMLEENYRNGDSIANLIFSTQVLQAVAELRKLFKTLYSHVTVIMRSGPTADIRKGFEKLMVNLNRIM